MATDFTTNQIAVSNTMVNLATNMPLDARTIINDINDASLIPNPFVGMIFYVTNPNDKNKLYFVKSLRDKIDATTGITIPNGLVDTYAPLINHEIYSNKLEDFCDVRYEDAKINALEKELLELEIKFAGDTNILTNVIYEDFSNDTNIIVNEGYYDRENKYISF